MEFGDNFEKKLEEAFQVFKKLQSDVPEKATVKMWVVDILSKHIYELLRQECVMEANGQKEG